MYSRKLLREKTFVNFEVLWLFTKVFFAKFGGVASIVAQVNNSQKFSPWKSYFPPIFEIFSLKSFVLYGMTLNVPSIFLSWRAVCSNNIIEGSCVNSADIMASIYALKCTQQFECYKYTLYTGMHYATRFRSNSKISSTQLTKFNTLSFSMYVVLSKIGIVMYYFTK